MTLRSVRHITVGWVAAIAATLLLPIATAVPAAAVPDCDGPTPPPVCGPGDPPPSRANPTGAIERVTRGPAGVSVVGWAADPDRAGEPLDVLLVLGTHSQLVQAATARPEVDGVEFAATINVDDLVGPARVCATVSNVGRGNDDTTLPCRQITVGHDPVGRLEEVNSGSAQLYVRGWALDPDSTAALSVDLIMDGTLVGTRPALIDRTDIAAGNPGYGINHGFDAVLPRPVNGDHTLCAVANNVGQGGRASVGCIRWQERNNAPVAPILVALEAQQQLRDGPYTVRMDYDDRSDDEFVFQVNRQSPNGDWAGHATLAGASGTGRRTSVLGTVTAENRYCYTLMAVTGAGAVSAASERCLDVPPLPPRAPSNVRLRGASTTSIAIAWNDNSNEESGFEVGWGPGTNAHWSKTNTAMAPGQEATGTVAYVISGLREATDYCIEIRSKADSPTRFSLPTDRLCTQTPKPPPPAAPSQPDVLTMTPTTITLRWVDNADNETGYRVERHYGTQNLREATLPANSNTYVVTRLSPGSTYCYRIVAVNAGGEGTSPDTCATTPVRGVKTLQVWNCYTPTQGGSLYRLNLSIGGGWVREASLRSSLTGSGCGQPYSEPAASVDVSAGHLVRYAVLLTSSTCPTEDPTNPNCRRLEFTVLGDPAGFTQMIEAGN